MLHVIVYATWTNQVEADSGSYFPVNAKQPIAVTKYLTAKWGELEDYHKLYQRALLQDSSTTVILHVYQISIVFRQSPTARSNCPLDGTNNRTTQSCELSTNLGVELLARSIGSSES